MSNQRPALRTRLTGIDVLGTVALFFAVVVAFGWQASSAEARGRSANSPVAPHAYCIDCKGYAHLNVPGHHRCSLAYRPSIVTIAQRHASFAIGGRSQNGLLPYEMRLQLADAWEHAEAPPTPQSVSLETFKSVFGKTRRMHT